MTDTTPYADTQPQPVVPRATYRLQLHKDFDFDAAVAIVPYLAALGVSHVYCSPITAARAGSLHGYDVADPTRINPELGGAQGFARLADAAHAAGLGLLVDIVPNHMGVFGADNPWWLDVLESGQASAYAGYFDIDWQPPNRLLWAKVLVPVLGDQYGRVLESGGLTLGFDAELGRLAISYSEHLFPLDPRTYPAVLRSAADTLAAPAADQLKALIEACTALPDRDDARPASRAQRREAIPQLQRELAALAQREPAVSDAIAAAAAACSEARDVDALHAIHEAQAYRLSSWRVASGEINYRRFFDVNSLAALKVEDQAVFDDTHRLALALVEQGRVDGLRIDHPDGLYDPAQYFERLQRARLRQTGAPADATTPLPATLPLYLLAEKIVGSFEKLPRSWALHGTTGYEFAMQVGGLFVERRSEARMTRLWNSRSNGAPDYKDSVWDCKKRVATVSLASQLSVLTNQLYAIAEADRNTRDYSFDDLRTAIAETAASMPVYRTYVVDQPSDRDRQFVDWAIADARRRSALSDDTVFDFLHGCLLDGSDKAADAANDTAHAALLQRFTMRFQQFCAPVAAKGVEDTAFYRYHRLISLNEVGGDPSVFGISAAAFHAANTERARFWPHTMLATSTHDNKRAEDVRCRIAVLSEQPAALRRDLRRWDAIVGPWRATSGGEPAPSTADLYLLFQTLMGVLPVDGLLTEETLPALRERIAAYLQKALREAKQHTRWDRPDAGYEAAVQAVVDKLFARLSPNPGLTELLQRAAEIAWFGAWNSLATTLLKLTSPGVPDIYQGTELIDLSLVDPDNRRAVDYATRADLLASLQAAATGEGPWPTLLAELARTPHDGRLKLWLIARVLGLRKAHPGLFTGAAYLPLRVKGAARNHALAYARRSSEGTVVVIVARKIASLKLGVGTLPVGDTVWGDTVVELPAGLVGEGQATGRNVLTGETLAMEPSALRLSSALGLLPLAAIHIA